MEAMQWAKSELTALREEHKRLGARITMLESLLQRENEPDLLDPLPQPVVPPLNTARKETPSPSFANGFSKEPTRHPSNGSKNDDSILPSVRKTRRSSSSQSNRQAVSAAMRQSNASPVSVPTGPISGPAGPTTIAPTLTGGVHALALSNNGNGTFVATTAAAIEPTPAPAPAEITPSMIEEICSDARTLGNIKAKVCIGLLPEVAAAMRYYREDPALVLRVSDGQVEWVIAKTLAQLKAFDNEVRANTSATLPQLPAKNLWQSLSPIKLDVRLDLVNSYLTHLHTLLPTFYPKAQMAYAQFMSSDFVQLNEDIMCSFLVSRSRFSGWKARFAVLNGSRLELLDKPQGSVGSTINLLRSVVSAIPDNITSSDDEYRHGFTINEPKDNSSKSTLHYFSAESKQQRDAWLAALEKLSSASQAVSSRSVVPFTVSRDRPSISTSDAQDNVSIFTRSDIMSIPPTSPITRKVSHASRRKSSLTVDFPPSSICFDGSISSAAGAVTSPRISSPQSAAAVAITHHNSGPTSALPQRRVMSPTSFSHSPHTNTAQLLLRTNVFRVPLTNVLEYSSVCLGNAVVPTIVGRCIEFLNFKQAYLEEGLFRISGTQSQVDNLEVRFERDDVDVDDLNRIKYDVHVVASVLKRFFRLLPEPLIEDLDENYWRDLMSQPLQTRNALLKQTVSGIPRTSFDVLDVMTQFLGEVHRNSAVNKMTPQNLGIIFSPTLGIPGSVIIAMIEHQEKIFAAPEQ